MKTIFAAMAVCLLPVAVLAQDSTTHDMPAGTHDMPAGTKDMPAGTHDMPAATHEMPAGLSASDVYARSTNPKTGAAYMMLHNGGQTTCTLSGVSTDAADMAEVHSTIEENGVAKMVPADPIVLPPGGVRELARGGDHLMLMGLKAPLKDGDTANLTLDFGDCGKLELAAPVDNRRKASDDEAVHAH